MGALIGLGRLGLAWRRLAKLRTTVQPLPGFPSEATLLEVRRVLKASGLPPIVVSPAAAGPAAFGLLRPMVVLPEAGFRTLASDRLRDVLVHECAHIVRRDIWVGVFQRISGIVFWFHPLVRLLNAQLARAREEVCDNLAIQSGDACRYARTLLELAERRAATPVGLAAGFGLLDARWSLEQRIAGLLDPRRTLMIRPTLKQTLIPLLALLILGLGGAAVRPRTGVGAPVTSQVADDPTTADQVIRGLVVDTEGASVPGARVRWMVTQRSDLEETRTESDGRFALRIPGRPKERVDLIAESEDGRRIGLGRYEKRAASEPPEPVKIVLEPARRVTVHVRDGQGAPVQGALVEAYGQVFQAFGQTDAAGDAVLELAAKGPILQILALKPGVGFDVFECYTEHPALSIKPPPEEVALRLDGAKTVRVRVVDSNGQPVSGVLVRPSNIALPNNVETAWTTQLRIAGATTDGQGVATFSWIPSELRWEAQFGIESDDYVVATGVKPAERSSENERRLLLWRKGRLRGVVRDEEGRPANGILVLAQGMRVGTPLGKARDRTDADGKFDLSVEPEQIYMVGVSDDRQAARSRSGIVVREGQTIEDLDFTLVPGSLLHGMVGEVDTEHPIPHLAVFLVEDGPPVPEEFQNAKGDPLTQSLMRQTTTDTEGKFQFRVGPGSYSTWLGGRDLDPRRPLTIDAEPDILYNLVAQKTRPRVVVGAEVLDSVGRPASGAVIEMFGEDEPFSSRTIASTEGKFALGRASSGRVVVYAHDRQGDQAALVRMDPERGPFPVELGPAASLAGRVVDENGAVRAFEKVTLFLSSGKRGAGFVPAFTNTDGDGRYEFRGLPVGARVEILVRGDPKPPLAEGPAVTHATGIEKVGLIELPDLVVPAP